MTLLSDLESAAAGSRELSDRVLLALGWRTDQITGTCWWRPENPEAPNGTGSWFSAVDCPSPTESVDDAIAEWRRALP